MAARENASAKDSAAQEKRRNHRSASSREGLHRAENSGVSADGIAGVMHTRVRTRQKPKEAIASAAGRHPMIAEHAIAHPRATRDVGAASTGDGANATVEGGDHGVGEKSNGGSTWGNGVMPQTTSMTTAAAAAAKRKGKTAAGGAHEDTKKRRQAEVHHHHHRSLRSAGSHGLDRDDACASRLRAEIEEGTIWDVAAAKTHRDCNAEDALETYAEWIQVRDRRIAANSRRTKKFIPLSDDVDTLLAAKDDVATTIMMLHKRELMYPISCGLKRHGELNGFCRSVVVAWMVEVNRDYNFSDLTLHAAVRILDAFLCRIDKSICRSQLQLVGVTAVLIASKFHEPALNLTPKECSWVTDRTYTFDEVILMERLMLSTLGYQVAFPLSLGFLHLYHRKLNGIGGGEGGDDGADGNQGEEADVRCGVAGPAAATTAVQQQQQQQQQQQHTSAGGANFTSSRLVSTATATADHATAYTLECDENVDGAPTNSIEDADGNVPDELVVLANYVIDNALLYADSLRFSPSLQAATALALSRCLPLKLSSVSSGASFSQHSQQHGGPSQQASTGVTAAATTPAGHGSPSSGIARDANVQSPSISSSWTFVMDDDIAEVSGYTTELAMECAKFLLKSLASSKGFGTSSSSGNGGGHFEAVHKKYAQLRGSDMLRTRRGSYSRANDGTEDIATVAQRILVAQGWCDALGSSLPPPPLARAAGS